MASLLLRKTLRVNQLRTLHRSAVAFHVPVTFNMYQNKQKFNEVLPEVMDSLMASPKFTNQLPEVRSWVKKLLNYTIVGGQQGKGLSVPFAYQKMEDPKYFTEEKLHTARILGWGVEIMEATLHVVDDIIDYTRMRRGKPCWYLLPNIGTSAIIDSFLIYHCLMEVMKMKFGEEPFYSDLVSLINEAAMHTFIGQYLDYSLRYSKEKNNLDVFTMERYHAVAEEKSSYFFFNYPMRSALLLVKNGKERNIKELSSICMELGKLLQYQNDYEDVYWDAATSGKTSTDIEEGKISWFAVTALERCNEEQLYIFKENFGIKDPECVNRIKQLYDELQLDKVYEQFKTSLYERLERRVRALPHEGETEFFLEILEACRNQTY